ncbi:MAG TPA: hypothetical protein VK737_12705, partial [Opitutales bacterium]|nr:hypothetical protein [Opitutales bacterium]
MSGSFQNMVENSFFMRHVFGFDQWQVNFTRQLVAGGLLAGLSAVLIVVGRDWSRQKRFGEAWWALLIVIGTITAGSEWFALQEQGWMEIGHALVFPVLLAAMLAV